MKEKELRSLEELRKKGEKYVDYNGKKEWDFIKIKGSKKK